MFRDQMFHASGQNFIDEDFLDNIGAETPGHVQ